MRTVVYTVLAAAILAGFILYQIVRTGECWQGGGEMVRTTFGYQCLQVKQVK